MLYFFSSSTTKQKVYMARFWLPLYSAVIMSMYAYGTLLTKNALVHALVRRTAPLSVCP